MPTVMEWTKRLLAKIEKQTQYAKPYEKRYRNEHILPFLAKEYAEVYPGIVLASSDGRVSMPVTTSLSALDVPRSGTAGIVVDALTERMTVLGGEVEGDKDATRALMAAWEANDLDVMHREAHREPLIKSRAFGSVARAKNDSSKAVVGIEPAESAAVARSQMAPFDVVAYLKVWTDEWTGKRAGMLRLPGLDHPLREDDTEHHDPEGSGGWSRWIADGDPIPTGLSYVPVVEFAHRSRLIVDPVSELEPIVTALDIVDLVEGLMVFAGHFGVVPIRWGTGLTIPKDPKNPEMPLLDSDGKPMIGMKNRSDHFWGDTNPAAKFGQLEPAGLASFVTWAEHASAKVRAQTKLPSSYFSLDLKSHMSAELIKTDEAPMVRRVRGIGEQGPLNAAWRRLHGYILDIEGVTTRGRVKARWENPETRIDSQLVDQFQKLVASGMGVETVAKQLLGWDPATVELAVKEAQGMREAGDPFDLLDAGTRAALKAVPSADPEPAAGA